jgi:hypothetical protein
MTKRKNYMRARQDLVSEEMTAALLKKASYDFNELFQEVYARLHERDATSGGEEMLRLRLYEKLQMLVGQGLVKKEAKKYTAKQRELRVRVADLVAAREKLQQQRGSMFHVE